MGTMADLLSRPTRARRGTARPPSPPRPVSLSGLVAAVTVAAQGLLAVTVLVLVGWATAADSGASASEALAAALQVWLVAHHTELVIPGGTFQLVPLGLVALPAFLLFTAAARATRASQVAARRGVVALTTALATSYAALAVLAALLGRTDAVRPQPVSAFLGAGALAIVAGGAGAIHGTGRRAVLWLRLPRPVRLVLRGGVAAAAALVCGGALLTGASLALHRDTVGELVRGLGTGAPGGLLVLLLCLAYVPTAAVWGCAYLAGPGFSVGTGTSVSMTGVALGAVPGLPLLGALPSGGDPSGLTFAAVLVPAAAGVVAGLVLEPAAHPAARSTAPGLGSWRRVLLAAAGSGGVAGSLLGVLAALATGPVGPGRFAVVGPSPWWVGLVVAAEVGAVAATTMFVRRGVTALRRRAEPAP